MGRGSEGEDESGSKAGNSEGAGRLTPATAGGTGNGSGSVGLLKGEFLLFDIFSRDWNETRLGWRWGLPVSAVRSNNCRHIKLVRARMRGSIKKIASSHRLRWLGEEEFDMCRRRSPTRSQGRGWESWRFGDLARA